MPLYSLQHILLESFVYEEPTVKSSLDIVSRSYNKCYGI